jgi:hypothetical protein
MCHEITQWREIQSISIAMAPPGSLAAVGGSAPLSVSPARANRHPLTTYAKTARLLLDDCKRERVCFMSMALCSVPPHFVHPSNSGRSCICGVIVNRTVSALHDSIGRVKPVGFRTSALNHSRGVVAPCAGANNKDEVNRALYVAFAFLSSPCSIGAGLVLLGLSVAPPALS